MSGNLARRRQTKFMPADFSLIESRQPPAERPVRRVAGAPHLLRLLGPVSPFVSQVNRATGETLRQQATKEGLVPLKARVKNALDHVIQVRMAEAGLKFVRIGDDAIDPLEQAPTLRSWSAQHQDASSAQAICDGTRAILGVRTKREHFLDRLRRSWHI